ncbi:Abi family protein [Legionella israelensis]|nr:Abi family protein [Legionella israelensis]
MNKTHYTNPPLSLHEQIDLLKKRGLQIPDNQNCLHHLSMVSFYRLSAYIRPFEVDHQTHCINPEISFDDVWSLYVFDRELRLLFLDAIERIEVAFRTSLVNVMAERYGAWWYLNADLFKSSWSQTNPRTNRSPNEEFIREVDVLCKQKTAESSIKDYFKKYGSPELPPCWMLFEYLSFGKCTSLFRFLKNRQDKIGISSLFKLHASVVESSIEALRYTRNLCAHHSRLWDRWFVVKPKQFKELQNANCRPGTLKEQIVLIELFHSVVSPSSSWKERLYNLFSQHITSNFPVEMMGFNQDWQEDQMWDSCL